jgi:hypothetical protein
MADKLSSGDCEPCTVFTVDYPIYARLGPAVSNLDVFSDLTQVKFRLEYRSVDEDDEEEDDWGSYMYDFPAGRPDSSSHCLVMVHDPDSLQLAPGNYKFRLAIFDNEKMTPFSEETAKISLSV